MNKGLTVGLLDREKMWTGYGHEVDRSQVKGVQEVNRRWAGGG